MIKGNVIIGYSGHAYVVLDILIALDYKITGYLENLEKLKNPYNLNYLGSEEDPQILDCLKFKNAFIGIGDNQARSKVFRYLKAAQINTPYALHPNAIISKKAAIGEATIVMPGCIINTLSIIGRGVICNTSSVIEHECIIGDLVHIAPGAVLAGNVSVGNNTFIGANSVIREGIRIGQNVIIGSGSVIIQDIPDGSKVAGNPAKQIG